MSLSNNRWKKAAIWTAPAMVGLIGFILGWVIFGAGNHHRVESTESITQVTDSDQGTQQLYTCSMHPQIRSPNPDDKCPICGMDLIPVPSEKEPGDESDLPRLRLTERAAALMQIQVWPVEKRQLFVPVRLYGRLGYDETKLQTISAWMPGRLDRLHVDFTGTLVRKGQPMVEIYSPRLIAAQEELLQTIRSARQLKKTGAGMVLDTTQMTVDASFDRLRLMGLGEEQIRRIEKQGHVDDHLVIPAPASGIVIERLASAGDYVETGQAIYKLADLSHLWVQLEVYESDLQWLEIGQRAVFTTQSHPGKNFEGTVSFIDPFLNDRTRTVRVRVDIPNPEGVLKPGMLVRGLIEAGLETYRAHSRTEDKHAGHLSYSAAAEKKNDDRDSVMPLVIPTTAPLITGERAVVYVRLPETEQPAFELREIVLGPRVGSWYVVREGLGQGELVVINGSFKIDSELQIRGRPSMMQPEGGAPPVHDHGVSAAHAAEAPGQTKPETFLAPSSFQEQLGRLVKVNFALVKALAGDDFEAARQAARQADEMLRRIEPDRLGEVRHKWDSPSRTIHDSLAAFVEAEDLSLQRRHFEAFSDALTEAVRTFGVQQTGPVYRAVCPMVQGRKGYWLQPQKNITNPYFGAMMLTCGEISETFVEPDTHDHGQAK